MTGTPSLPSQAQLMSVTTILKLGVPKGGDALIGWAARQTATAAVRHERIWKAILEEKGEEEAIRYLTGVRFETTKKAQWRGTLLHNIAEAWNLGETYPIAPEDRGMIEPYAQNYARFLREHRPTLLMAEAPIFNFTWGYGGTLDSIMELPGLPGPVVVDVKTTDKEPGPDVTRPPYAEVALQLAAYRRGEWVTPKTNERFSDRSRRYYLWDALDYHVPMPETVGAFCLVVSPYDYELVSVVTDDTVFRSFQHACAMARWTDDYSTRVLRRAVTLPTVQEAA